MKNSSRLLRTRLTPIKNSILFIRLISQTKAKHSAIITSVSAGTGVNQIVVASKWGYYGVYSHILSDCPYYTDAEHGTTHYLTNVKYYRLSHQYILSGNYYYCKCCGYKNPTMVVSGVTK